MAHPAVLHVAKPATPSPAAPAAASSFVLATPLIMDVARVVPPPPPPAPAVAVPAMATLDVSRLAVLHSAAIRPRFDLLKPARKGFTRAESRHPISPVAPPVDTVLFEDPQNPAKRYWLPRHALRVINSQKYGVNFALGTDQKWRAEFQITVAPAPELRDRIADPNLSPLDYACTVSLLFTAPGTTIERRFDNPEILKDANGFTAAFQMELAERDELLSAFRDRNLKARLVIARAISVATPLPPEADDGEAAGQPASQPAASPGVSALRAAAIRPEIVRSLPAERAFDRADMLRARRRIPRPDGTSPPPPPQAEVRYTHYTGVLVEEAPLYFEQASHPYIYPQGWTQGSTTAAFERVVLNYPASGPNSTPHTYFHDLVRPERFYFLPDAFKLARSEGPPYRPGILFDVEPGEADGKARVSITCDVRPETDGMRLMAAFDQLKARLAARGGQPVEPVLESLPADAVAKLGLKRDGVIKTVSLDADVSLINGFAFTEVMSLDDFQDVFAAMMSTSVSPLLRGEVVVESGLPGSDKVELAIRFSDMEGEMFSYAETADAVTGVVQARLKNETESPLQIKALDAWVRRGVGEMTRGEIEGLDLSQPVTVPKEGSLQFTVRPSQPLPGDGPIDVVFDTWRVFSVPDVDAILALTLDEAATVPARKIELQTADDVLDDNATPEGPIRMIAVEFRGREAIKLQKGKTEASVLLSRPLAEMLRRTAADDTYEFRQTVIYKSNRQAADTRWRRSDASFLFLPLPAEQP